jgi:hypothetical protein
MGTDTTEERAHRGTTEWNVLLVRRCLQVARNDLVVVVGDFQRLEITVLLTPASDTSAGLVGGAEEAELGVGRARPSDTNINWMRQDMDGPSVSRARAAGS